MSSTTSTSPRNENAIATHTSDIILRAVLSSFLELQNDSNHDDNKNSSMPPPPSPENVLLTVSRSHPTLATRLRECSTHELQQTLVLVMELISKVVSKIGGQKQERVTTNARHSSDDNNDNYGIFQVFENSNDSTLMNLPLDDLLFRFCSSENEVRIIEQTCVALIVATVRQKQQEGEEENQEKKEKSVSYHRGDKQVDPPSSVVKSEITTVKKKQNDDALVSVSPPSSVGSDPEELEEEEEILVEEEVLVEEEEEEEEEDEIQTFSTPPQQSTLPSNKKHSLTSSPHRASSNNPTHVAPQEISPFPSLMDLSHQREEQQKRQQENTSSSSSKQQQRRQWTFYKRSPSPSSSSKSPTKIVRFQDSPSKHVHSDEDHSVNRLNISIIPDDEEEKEHEQQQQLHLHHHNINSDIDGGNLSTVEGMMSIIADEVADRRQNNNNSSSFISTTTTSPTPASSTSRQRRSWIHPRRQTTTTPHQQQQQKDRRPPPSPPAFSRHREEMVEKAKEFRQQKDENRAPALTEKTFLFWWQQTALRRCATYLVMKRNFTKWKAALEEERKVKEFQQNNYPASIQRQAFSKWKQNFNCRFFQAQNRTLKTTSRLLRRWQQKANQAPLVRAFTALRAHNLASRALHTWTVRFNIRQETRQLEEQARQTLLLRHALSRWMRIFSETKREDEFSWRVFKQPLLKKSMNRWIRKLFASQATRFLQKKNVKSLEHNTFLLWKRRLEAKKEKEDKMVEEFEITVRQRSLLKVAMNTWSLNLKMEKLLQEKNAAIAKNVLMNVWRKKALLSIMMSHQTKQRTKNNNNHHQQSSLAERNDFGRKMLTAEFSLPQSLQNHHVKFAL